MLMKPILDEFAKSNRDVFVGSIDARFQDLHSRYDVKAVPQLVLLIDGREIARNVGPLSSAELANFLKCCNQQGETANQ